MSQAGHSLSPEHINIQTTITAHTHQAGRQAGTKGPSASLLSVHSQLESVSLHEIWEILTRSKLLVWPDHIYKVSITQHQAVNPPLILTFGFFLASSQWWWTGQCQWIQYYVVVLLYYNSCSISQLKNFPRNVYFFVSWHGMVCHTCKFLRTRLDWFWRYGLCLYNFQF